MWLTPKGFGQATGVGVTAEHDLVSVCLNYYGEGESHDGGNLVGDEHSGGFWFVGRWRGFALLLR